VTVLEEEISSDRGRTCPPGQRFEGALIRLRAREPEDEPLFHRWMNDPEVTEHLPSRYPVSHLFETALLEAMSPPDYRSMSLAIETREDSQLIGAASLRRVDAESRSAELGIMIGDREYWDGGYGTDTMNALCRFGFEMMNLRRIWLEVYALHERAVHVYEKVGFQHEALLRDAVFKFGEWQDVLVMAKVREGDELDV
jgi:RimJ/RimL family protein N-acetyltransferase